MKLPQTFKQVIEQALSFIPERNGRRRWNVAKMIMVQGTMSNAGKSFLAAGLCRVFKQDGWRVAPFKAQNMALNSFVTKEAWRWAGLRSCSRGGRGEAVCADESDLLKPTGDTGSQVIVNGEVRGNMTAREYFASSGRCSPTSWTRITPWRRTTTSLSLKEQAARRRST